MCAEKILFEIGPLLVLVWPVQNASVMFVSTQMIETLADRNLSPMGRTIPPPLALDGHRQGPASLPTLVIQCAGCRSAGSGANPSLRETTYAANLSFTS